MSVVWSGSEFPFLGTFTSGGVPPLTVISFDTVSVGASNPSTAVAARIPLPIGFIPLTVNVVAGNVGTSAAFNIVFGEASEFGSAPLPGTYVTNGQALFAGDQPLPAAGTVQTFNAQQFTAQNLIFGPGELTLRVPTTGSGGVGNLKVTLTGTWVGVPLITPQYGTITTGVSSPLTGLNVVRLYGTSNTSGVISLAHGITNANQSVQFASAFYRGSAGQAVPMTITSVDGTYVNASGATASVACRADIIVSSDQQGW